MNKQVADGLGELSGRSSLLELNRFAAAALMPMLDPKTQLFCHRVYRTSDGLVREGVSPRYSAMTLLGLHRWEQAGGCPPIEIRSTMDLLLEERAWLNNIGDLGLMLWLSAAVAPQELGSIYDGLNTDSAWERLAAAQSPTMELAWFLTGLSYAAGCLPRDRQESVRNLAGQAYRLLRKNQGESGLFGHQPTSEGLRGRIRGRIGSFADQVYPIYALTQYARSYGDDEALGRARQCADAISNLQGPLGQWWWHYDAAAGKTFQRYPVYSVHQDGMAPMALWAVGEATGRDYSGPIDQGLAWIYGNNEPGCDMRDQSYGTIWRSVYSTGLRRRTREALDVFGFAVQSTSDLRVLYECRPYHLGWLLYAFAGRDGN